jgi:deoxyhypusine synthase
VVCYCDSTIAVPLIAAYAIATRPSRKLKRLYDRREALMRQLRDEYQRSK